MRRLLFVALLIFGANSVFAQSGTGTFNGRVTDPTGAIVPGASVAVTNPGTGVSRTAVTNGDGLYSVPALPPGVYNVKAEATGFSPVVKEGVKLVTDSTLSLDFSLQVAGSAQQVEVTGEAPLVETTQSEVSGSIQVSEVQNLPMLNRNLQAMVTLIPGTSPAAANRVAFGGAISVGGGIGKNLEVEVDGVPHRDNTSSGGPLFNFTLEGVQEFKVLTHEYGTQYGKTSGAVIQVATKSGTNQVHGTAFGYGRDAAMTATDYFSDPAHGGVGKPPYDREQFGGSIGGPIVKDKMFFFGAIERIQQNNSLVYPASTYNQAVLLKQTLSSLTTCPICVQVGSAIVPAQASPQYVRDLEYTAKWDYQINSHHSVIVRFLGERLTLFNDRIGGSNNLPHPDIDPNGSNVTDGNPGFSIMGSETWIIGNNSVNTFAVVGSRLTNSTLCNCGPASPYWVSRNLLFPDFAVGVAGGTGTNTYTIQETVDFRDDFSHQVGKHALKFGGDFAFFPQVGSEYYGPAYILNNTFNADPSTIISQGGFLRTGIVSSVSVGENEFPGAVPGNAIISSGVKQAGVYIQDDWKLTNRLTLNLGLRYDLNINWLDESENAQNRVYLALKAIGSPYAYLPHDPKRDFGPRVGFAWDITGNGKNVLRGGFGIFFDQPGGSFANTNIQQSKALLGNLYTTYSSVQLPGYIYGLSPLPPAGTLNPTQLPAGGLTTGGSYSPGLTDPRNEQSHIGYTRQLTANTVVSVDYTHILGLHELRVSNGNPIEGPWDPNAASYNFCGASGSVLRLQCQLGQVLGDPKLIGQIQILASNGRSQYDEMILHIENRHRVVTLQASYTLSRADGWGGAVAGFPGHGLMPQNPDQFFGPGEWGPSANDERHRAVLAGVFNLPFGIQASPIFQIDSDRPYTLTQGRQLTASDLLVAPSACCVGDGLSTDRWINPATGQQVGVNSARGSATWDFDTRISKFFNFGSEARRLGVFAEIYNITNKANFGNNYNGNAKSPTFMQPTGYFNNGVSYANSRQLQLGARFIF